jgi:hypothetical protein
LLTSAPAASVGYQHEPEQLVGGASLLLEVLRENNNKKGAWGGAHVCKLPSSGLRAVVVVFLFFKQVVVVFAAIFHDYCFVSF